MTNLQDLFEHVERLSVPERRELSARLDALPWGDIIATNVSLDDYMTYYAEDSCEWVEGYVIKM